MFRPIQAMLALLAMATAAFAHNEGFRMTFTAELSGDQVSPKVATEARGVAGFTFNGHGDSVSFHGAATRLSGPITGLALHAASGASAGNLLLDIAGGLKGNSFSGNLPATPNDLGKYARGDWFLVISTAANPKGEIAGRITLARNRQYVTELTGDHAVPKSNSAASGFGAFYLSPDDSVLTVRAVFGELKDSITSVHFGYGKDNAADAVDLDVTGKVTGGILAATLKLPAEAHGAAAKRSGRAHVPFAGHLAKGEVFLTVRTKAHPSGEIRGQLAESKEWIFIAEMTGARNVPASPSTALGLTLAQLSPDDSTLTFHAAYLGLDSVSSIHVHRGSRTSNPDTLPTEPQADLAASLKGGNYLKTTQKTGALKAGAAAFLKDLMKGSVMTNVHTKAFPNGAIRGQLLAPYRLGTVAFIQGSQETPAVATKAFGAVLATLDPDSGNVEYKIVADSLGSAFTMAHIHKQAVGVAGGVVLDLTPAFRMKPDSMTGLLASGTWWSTQPNQPFTRALAKAFAAESLYVNIHSKNNGGGEIRGQIKDAIPDTRVVRTLPGAFRGFASRLILGAGARGIRIQGPPGASIQLAVTDLRGRAALRTRLTFGADGLTPGVDLGDFRPGLYVAAWGEGSSRRTARFPR